LLPEGAFKDVALLIMIGGGNMHLLAVTMRQTINFNIKSEPLQGFIC
jgi:hypothetical protein